jgi:hypothetical protein
MWTIAGKRKREKAREEVPPTLRNVVGMDVALRNYVHHVRTPVSGQRFCSKTADVVQC